jgi:hypothetical protein
VGFRRLKHHVDFYISKSSLTRKRGENVGYPDILTGLITCRNSVSFGLKSNPAISPRAFSIALPAPSPLSEVLGIVTSVRLSNPPTVASLSLKNYYHHFSAANSKAFRRIGVSNSLRTRLISKGLRPYMETQQL